MGRETAMNQINPATIYKSAAHHTDDPTTLDTPPTEDRKTELGAQARKVASHFTGKTV